ncbi:MAG: succinylglutamate desuccinylase/aspartoacylase family protein [Bacteroidota bacterium]
MMIQGVPIEPGKRTDIALNISRLSTYTPIDLPVRIFRADEPGPVVLHPRPIDKSFRKAAARYGKPILVYESGKAHRFDGRGIDEGVQGILRLMSYLEMRSPVEEEKPNPVFYRKSTRIRARNAGLFRPEVMQGQTVRTRQKPGRITDSFGDELVRVETRREGRVIGINYSPVVHKGDALLHLAYEEMKELL